jgi:hypothetical protein
VSLTIVGVCCVFIVFPISADGGRGICYKLLGLGGLEGGLGPDYVACVTVINYISTVLQA